MQMSDIKIKEVVASDDFDIWYDLYSEIFPKKEDRFPHDFILNWILEPSETKQNLLIIKYNDQNVGFIWQMVNKEIKTAYYYYLGIIKAYRGKGIFSKVQKKNEKYLLDNGVEIILAEQENPRLMKTKDEKAEALRRIKFYLDKIGFSVVSDNEIQYLRHYPPNLLNKVQDYYMLSFKCLTKSMNDLLVVDGKLTKEGFKKLYLNQARIELGITSENELKQKSKAANKFLSNLDLLNTDKLSFLDNDNLT
jgi:hypothetical protein